MFSIFHPGQRLIFHPSRPESADYQVYDDFDNFPDVEIFSDEVPNPTWNYERNMPQAVYEDIAEMNSQNLRDQAAEIRLSDEATNCYTSHCSF